MCAAVCRTFERERLSPLEQGVFPVLSFLQTGLQRPGVALEMYVSFLEKREHLLDPCLIDELVGGVARESLSSDVTQCAESLGESLKRLSHRDMNTREQWQEHRDAHVIPAAGSFQRIARRQAAAPMEPASRVADEPRQPTLHTERNARTEQELARDKELAIAWVAWSRGKPHPRIKQFLLERNGIKPTEEEYADAKRAINTHNAAKKSRAKKRIADTSDMTHL